MHLISRRLFLAGSAAIVVGACTGDGEADPSSTPSPDSASGGSASAPTDLPPTGSTTPASDAATTSVAAPTTTVPAIEFASTPFTLGVASGDPGVDSVVLWTRLALDPLQGGGMPPEDIEVQWQVALDEAFADVVVEGTASAAAQYGHSVHVDARVEAQAGTDAWFYRFSAGGHTSPVGRTRPAPSPSGDPGSVRFASASCQNYEDGFYTAHRDLAAQAPEFVVWLGDYIYEGRQGAIGQDENVRTHGTDEIVGLDDYRNRYALYKSDPDLQAAHAVCPWYMIWDDHEVENNYAGLTPQDPAEAAAFAQRRRDAYQAWWEHQPVSLPPPTDDPDAEYRIYRSARWGSLLDLALVDGRQYRTDQACGDPSLSFDPPCPETFDVARTMLGDEQEQWLSEHLAATTSTWNVMAQQTVFGDTTIGGAVLNYDQWDGYPGQRNRIVDSLATEPVDGRARSTVVLTGDIHFAGTGTIRSGGRGAGTPVAVEFVATSISSGGRVNPSVTDVVKAIPDILDVELDHRGYIIHTVTPEAWTAEYRMVESVKVPDSTIYVYRTYRVDAGTNTVRFADT